MDTVTTSELLPLVKAVIKAKLVPNIIGSPGIGKSDLVRQIAKDFNLKLIDVRLAQCDPTDLQGFPTLNEDRSRSDYAPPVLFPIEGDTIPEGYKGWLLFLDELPAAPMSVQAAAYKLILDKQVGQHNLHKNVAIVAAGNSIKDNAVANRMGTAMQSRMVHLELAVDHDAWVMWAMKNKIDYRIIGYVNFVPSQLHNFNPKHNDHTFPCPRTWEFLSKLIKDIVELPTTLLPLIRGTVGQGTGVEFKSFCEVFKNLPTFKDILDSPDTTKIPPPGESSTLFALASLLSSNVSTDNIDQLIIYINRMPTEFQVLALNNAAKLDPKLKQNPVFLEWILEHVDDLTVCST